MQSSAQDLENGNGTSEQHRVAAERAGAQVASLKVGHWWPVTDPRSVARALADFWSRLSD